MFPDSYLNVVPKIIIHTTDRPLLILRSTAEFKLEMSSRQCVATQVNDQIIQYRQRLSQANLPSKAQEQPGAVMISSHNK